jgi:hypothetical protein
MHRKKFVKDSERWKLFMQFKETICDSFFLQTIQKGIIHYMYLTIVRVFEISQAFCLRIGSFNNGYELQLLPVYTHTHIYI